MELISGVDVRVMTYSAECKGIEIKGFVQAFEHCYVPETKRYYGHFVVIADKPLPEIAEEWNEKIVTVSAANEYGNFVILEPTVIRVLNVESGISVDDVVYEAKIHFDAVKTSVE